MDRRKQDYDLKQEIMGNAEEWEENKEAAPNSPEEEYEIFDMEAVERRMAQAAARRKNQMPQPNPTDYRSGTTAEVPAPEQDNHGCVQEPCAEAPTPEEAMYYEEAPNRSHPSQSLPDSGGEERNASVATSNEAADQEPFPGQHGPGSQPSIREEAQATEHAYYDDAESGTMDWSLYDNPEYRNDTSWIDSIEYEEEGNTNSYSTEVNTPNTFSHTEESHPEDQINREIDSELSRVSAPEHLSSAESFPDVTPEIESDMAQGSSPDVLFGEETSPPAGEAHIDFGALRDAEQGGARDTPPQQVGAPHEEDDVSSMFQNCPPIDMNYYFGEAEVPEAGTAPQPAVPSHPLTFAIPLPPSTPAHIPLRTVPDSASLPAMKKPPQPAAAPVEPLHPGHTPEQQGAPAPVFKPNDSMPRERITMAFGGGGILISYSVPSVMDKNKLVPGPIRFTRLELEGEGIVDYRKRNKTEIVDMLTKEYPKEYGAAIRYIATKNTDSLSKQELKRSPPKPMSVCTESERVNRCIKENNWAEAFFLAETPSLSSQVLKWYARATTKDMAEYFYALLCTGNDQLACQELAGLKEEELVDIVIEWLYVLKGAVLGKCSVFAVKVVKLFLERGMEEEGAVFLFVCRSAMDLDVSPIVESDKSYRTLRLLLMYSEYFGDQIDLAEQLGKYLVALSGINLKKARELYRDMKDQFTRQARTELEVELQIQPSSWGLTRIINAMDKGITRMIGETPEPQTAPATPTQVVPPAPHYDVVAPVRTPHNAIFVANPSAEAPVAPEVSRLMPASVPPAAPVSPATEIAPVVPAKQTRPPAPAADLTQPAPSIVCVTDVGPSQQTKTAPLRRPEPVKRSATYVDLYDDNANYKEIFSDASRYVIIDDRPKKSWLGGIFSRDKVADFLRKFSREKIPVVKLSEDTIFVYDKVEKKWISVDANTLRPIKQEVTTSRPEDSSPTPPELPGPSQAPTPTAATPIQLPSPATTLPPKAPSETPRPMPLPVINGPMPQRGPDGRALQRPAGKSLEERYGKPRIPVQDAPPAEAFFIPPALYSSKNAKGFIPKPAETDTEEGHSATQHTAVSSE